MIYKDFKGLSLSALGFGAMRLPVLDGDNSKIDEETAGRMVDYALAQGINYFDTAWGYHGENSEAFIGKALRKHPRDQYYIATKFPGYDLSNMPKVKEIFEEQLKRTGMEYFDFYLLHNVCEKNIRAYLNPKYGIMEYLLEQKKNGRIRHLGFSSHGEPECIKKFLERYGADMEFCQIQLNWFDWTFQHGREKTELLKEYGLPIWVMEPLRGGKLVNLTARQQEMLKKLRRYESIPAWSFRFLESIPEVTMVLSGMSDEEQLKQNIEIFAESSPLNDEENEALAKIAKEMMAENTVPCTDCHYCVRHCPIELDIPGLIAMYNEHEVTTAAGQWDFIVPFKFESMPADRMPSACLHCKSCERVCPQHIHVSDVMADFAKKFPA